MVVGTRPNLVKAAPLLEDLKSHPEFEPIIVHTGQHYDDKLAADFGSQLGLPNSIIQIESNHLSGEERIELMTQKLETVIEENKPHMVIVFGDVDSTLAGALAANRKSIPLAHVESGLRSFDTTMKEEYNRVRVDKLSQFHFVTESSGVHNLINEGVKEASIHFVGNIMMDALRGIHFDNKEDKRDPFILWTVHRDSNVDDRNQLKKILDLLEVALQYRDVVWPVHPRTNNALLRFGLWDDFQTRSYKRRLHVSGPMLYQEFQQILTKAEVVVTDSGGLQEETCVAGVPCLTLRNNTERPSTVDCGANVLIKRLDKHKFEAELNRALVNDRKWDIPKLWDGQTSSRIIKVLEEHFIGSKLKATVQ